MQRQLIKAKTQFTVNSPHRQLFQSIHIKLQAGASENKISLVGPIKYHVMIYMLWN